jgi:hypothetical protein
MYIRTVPGKKLFSSTLIHEVVNRGDIFAVRLRDHCLTIIPGTAEVSHTELEVCPELDGKTNNGQLL